MQISAALVKELRERTGSGMMECKKALVESGGDIDAAADLLRKLGAAKADKKAGRIAAEGLIGVAQAGDDSAVAMVEVNCETDFVAKDPSFRGFVDQVTQVALMQAPADLDGLLAASLPDGQSVEEGRRALIAKIGENVSVRRFTRLETAGRQVGVYQHGTRIAVVTVLEGGDAALAKDIAMHVAASRPVSVRAEELSPELVAKEREIAAHQARESGKPDSIVEKMVEGKLRKWMAEVTLYGQPFVKDPDTTVEKLLEQAGGAEVLGFVRMEVGEGIEKRSENFADEVMAQVRGD